MNEQETRDYLEQHFKLYEAQELAVAYQRVMASMVPHLVELAANEVATQFVKDLLQERART